MFLSHFSTSVALVLLFLAWLLRKKLEAQKPSQAENKSTSSSLTSTSPIEPLDDFQWDKAEPLILRPFKPRYHITMGKLTHSILKLSPTLTHNISLNYMTYATSN